MQGPQLGLVELLQCLHAKSFKSISPWCDATEKFRLEGSHDPHPPEREFRTSLTKFFSRAVACADCRTSGETRVGSPTFRKEAGSALLRSPERAIDRKGREQCRP